MPTYNISGLIKNVCFNALWCHPLDREFLLIPLSALGAKIVVAVDVLSQSKVRDFNDIVPINPATKSVQRTHSVFYCLWFLKQIINRIVYHNKEVYKILLKGQRCEITCSSLRPGHGEQT